jgi:hypothetical protein
MTRGEKMVVSIDLKTGVVTEIEPMTDRDHEKLAEIIKQLYRLNQRQEKIKRLKSLMEGGEEE